MDSQKNIFYVPWADIDEWNTVRKQMFSADIEDTIKAYQTILMWKLKYPSVPAYIECTYSLLQVMIKEYEMSKKETSSTFAENELQLSYSMALIRFVNHVFSISSPKGVSLYFAAKTRNIPDWIINMRHDVSHGQKLPTLDALHQAAELSLQWLLDNYWSNVGDSEEENFELNSHIDVGCINFDSVDIELQKFFKKVFDLWEMCQNKNQNNLFNITEANEEFLLQVTDTFDSYIDYFSTSENKVYGSIKKIIIQHKVNKDTIKKKYCYRFKHFKMWLLKLLKIIINENPQLKHLLVLSLLETTILLENNFDPVKWQKVLRLLQRIKAFQLFLENLFDLVGKGHKGASKWLSVLAPSIKFLKKQWAMLEILKKEKINSDLKIIKRKISQTISPEPDVSVLLEICKPPVITLGTLKSCLLNPDNLSLQDIIQYLNLVKPPLMKETLNMIIETVRLQKGDNIELEISEDDKIYTVEDISEILVCKNNFVVEESMKCKGWARSSLGFDAWNKCPLGLLPFQSKVDCTLPNNLKWKKSKSSYKSDKTLAIPLLKHGISMEKLASHSKEQMQLL